jgi:hypothetical protein
MIRTLLDILEKPTQAQSISVRVYHSDSEEHGFKFGEDWLGAVIAGEDAKRLGADDHSPIFLNHDLFKQGGEWHWSKFLDADEGKGLSADERTSTALSTLIHELFHTRLLSPNYEPCKAEQNMIFFQLALLILMFRMYRHSL